MRQESFDQGNLLHAPCSYGLSRIPFRGPPKGLDRPYIACIGGSDTYGKFVTHPFPALLETSLQRDCVNLGCVNAGIDAFVYDPDIIDICQAADLTIVQLLGANNMSNRFYSVHPRRNDRFLYASPKLQAIYPEVNFTEFTFTRHLLGFLHAVSADRFEKLVHELRQAWAARMQQLLVSIGPRCVLLWFSEQPVTDAHWSDRPAALQADPLFVTNRMIEMLRPLVQDVVLVNPTQTTLAQGSTSICVPASQEPAAGHLLGLHCHEQAADAITAAVQGLLTRP